MLGRFARFRAERYSQQDGLFDPEREHVFKSEYAHYNLFDPGLDHWLPHSRRHRWFASMGSSQALAVSAFGTMLERGELARLNEVPDEHGRPLLAGFVLAGKAEFDHLVTALNELKPTQVDLFLPGQHGNVAIECKFWEDRLSPCSQVPDACDGRHDPQNGQRCVLAEKGITYWQYIPGLFHWTINPEEPTCPIRKPYQLVRNVLAAAVHPQARQVSGQPVTVLIYDANNPACAPGSEIDRQYRAVETALQGPAILKRTTWQAIVGVLAERGGYSELVAWLEEKYGIGVD